MSRLKILLIYPLHLLENGNKRGKTDLEPYKEFKKTEPNAFNEAVVNLPVILLKEKHENKKLNLKDSTFSNFEGSL